MRILLLTGDVSFLNVVAERKPWCAGSETSVLRAVPTHRASFRITAQTVARHKLLKDVLRLLARDGYVRHAEFVSSKKERSSFQGHQQHCENTHLCLTDPARHPLFVVTTDDPIRPGVRRQSIEVRIHRRLHSDRRPLRIQKCEIERQVKTGAVITIEVTDAVGLALHLTGEHAVGKFICHRAQLR